MANNTVLLLHVYLTNHWLSVCKKLLKNVPHDDVYVHVAYKTKFSLHYLLSKAFFRRLPKVRAVYYSLNNHHPEKTALETFRLKIDWNKYSVLSYIHAKGVTKPHNKNIKDWVELMRYFIMDRMDICQDAFKQGYKLYGTNLNIYDASKARYGPFIHSDFHLSGNFVSLNLSLLRTSFLKSHIPDDYFGVEGFWGTLCDMSELYCPHSAPHDLYHHRYPSHLYKNTSLVFALTR